MNQSTRNHPFPHYVPTVLEDFAPARHLEDDLYWDESTVSAGNTRPSARRSLSDAATTPTPTRPANPVSVYSGQLAKVA